MKAELGIVQETMLIPLVIKASETMRPNPRIHDRKAVEILGELEVDRDKYDKFMSHEGVVARTIMFDRTLKGYLKHYPDAVCVNLGCGLDSRFSRVDNGRLLWYDIDFPDVIRLREQFFGGQSRVRMIAASILEEDWTAQVEKGKKVIFIAEGLLMYFNREQVQELLGIISRSFPDYVMLAELMSPVAAKMSRHHDTVKHTGASFAWGTKSGKELEKICPGLRLVRENSFNDVMKGFTFRGWLFGTLPKIKHCNDRLAVFQYGC